MQLPPHSVQALLEWYAAMGVDEAISDTPLDYRIVGKKPAPPSPPVLFTQPELSDPMPRKSSHAEAAPTHVTEAIQQAKSLAENAKTLEMLYEAINGFDGCDLKKTAMHTVIADGNPKARLMVIGEAPGADEDRRGIPFCGESGQLLDKIFAAVGLHRGDSSLTRSMSEPEQGEARSGSVASAIVKTPTENTFYITNMIFWRPPGNRNPTAEELAICRPFVEKHIALKQPDILVLVGGIAATSLLKTPSGVGITKLRGKMQQYHCPLSNRDIPTLAMLHPSYLLRQPTQKKQAWADALMLRQWLSTKQ